MTKVQIIGPKPRLEDVLNRLYSLKLLQLSRADEEPALELAAYGSEPARETRAEDLRLLITQLDGLLTLAGEPNATEHLAPAAELKTSLREELLTVTPHVDTLTSKIDALRTEAAVLPRYLEPLRRLLPLIPELSKLDESALGALQLDTMVLVLNTEDNAVLDTLRTALRELLGDRFALVATRVDQDAIGCVIVFPHDAAEPVRVLLGRERVRNLPLPEAYEHLSFRGAVAALEDRLSQVPAELARTSAELHTLLAPRASAWRARRAALAATLAQVEAVERTPPDQPAGGGESCRAPTTEPTRTRSVESVNRRPKEDRSMNRYKLLTGLFALDVALFVLAGVPAFKHAHHGVKWVVGGIGWFGGLACTLILIVLALTTLAQHARARRARTI